jgi:uncharacterized OsmC-like protein
MFRLVLKKGPWIEVTGQHHTIAYAIDGTLPNPLEAVYSALAGCAGVYAKKACRELGIDDSGIAISLRITARPDKPHLPARMVTTLEFPERFNSEQRAAIRKSVGRCTVKTLMQHGAEIEFPVT